MHFGDASSSLGNRVLEAQTAILFLAVSAYLLAALFAERRESEARLASANTMLERERDNKLMTLQAVMASISHEIKQPLSAIALNGAAARDLLKSAPPDLAEAQSALNDVINDSHRSGQILDNLQRLFSREKLESESIDINDLALSTLHLLRNELADHGVAPALDLAAELPLVMGQKTQLQEVLLNLFHNAIEAMAAIKTDRRALKVRTALAAGKKILIEIENSGPGIDPERLESIFDAFLTTKPHGTGLGLAICSAIVERHGGQLSPLQTARTGRCSKSYCRCRRRKWMTPTLPRSRRHLLSDEANQIADYAAIAHSRYWPLTAARADACGGSFSGHSCRASRKMARQFLTDVVDKVADEGRVGLYRCV